MHAPRIASQCQAKARKHAHESVRGRKEGTSGTRKTFIITGEISSPRPSKTSTLLLLVYLTTVGNLFLLNRVRLLVLWNRLDGLRLDILG